MTIRHQPGVPPVEAVLVDLDDTLYPQADWLAGAWRATAERVAGHGVDAAAFETTLRAVAAGGTDRGRIIDRALASVGRPDVPVAPLVAAFRGHAPASLRPYPGVPEAVRLLRGRVPLAMITDGDPVVQRAKVAALGLADAFDVIVYSDELGRDRRKPHPAPFRAALGRLGLPATAAAHVGDRPEKDTAGALAVGLRAVRVRTGEYAACPDLPGTWLTAPDFPAAAAAITPWLAAAPVGPRRPGAW